MSWNPVAALNPPVFDVPEGEPAPLMAAASVMSSIADDVRTRADAALCRGRLPERHVELAECFPDVVAARNRRHGRKLVQVRASARPGGGDAADAEVRREAWRAVGVDRRAERIDLDGIGTVGKRLVAVRQARR